MIEPIQYWLVASKKKFQVNVRLNETIEQMRFWNLFFYFPNLSERLERLSRRKDQLRLEIVKKFRNKAIADADADTGADCALNKTYYRKYEIAQSERRPRAPRLSPKTTASASLATSASAYFQCDDPSSRRQNI